MTLFQQFPISTNRFRQRAFVSFPIRCCVLAGLLLLALSATARANGGAGVRLSAERLNLGAGNEMAVDILAEGVPPVYGVDVRLRFDPAQLEVVDADASAPGIQAAHGDFINPAQSFILENRANNQAGTVDYALTLLRPAPPAQGNGVLARVTFRAKVDGWATVAVEQAAFGTQTGQTIPANAPAPMQAGFTASATEGAAPLTVAFTNTSSGNYVSNLWDFGDGASSTLANPTHTFMRAGQYTVTLTITNASGEASSALLVITIAVSDEVGGSITGSGWIPSPPGAYPGNPSLTGKARFGFFARYKKNGSPTGSARFEFKAANFRFRSDSYEWLIISGARAWFKGAGTVNGVGGYQFLVMAIDGNADLHDTIKADRFRIKIWRETGGSESIVYDNGLGSTDFSEAWATELGGGKIVIQYKN